MINKKYIHLLNYFAGKNLLTGESKPVFKKTGSDIELISSKERDKEALKGMQELFKQRIEDLKDYEKGFDRFIKNKTTVEIKGRTSINAVLNELLGGTLKSTPKKIRDSKAFSKFFINLFGDVKYIFEQNAKIIQENMPCKVTLDKGGKLRFHNDNNFNLNFDIRKSSNNLQLLENLRNDIKALKERLSKKREVVIKKAVAQKKVLKKNVQTMLKEKPTTGFDNLVKSDYLIKEGKGYVVKFLTPKGKIDKKAEKETKIHDLFDLNKLKGGNILIRFKVAGVTPAGKKFEHWAKYHKGSGTFYIEGLKGKPRRVRIYNDTVISNITYEAGTYVAPKVKPKAKVEKPKAAVVTAQKEKAKEKAEAKEAADRREAQDNLIDGIYYDRIFKNLEFTVPKYLRDDKDFNNVERWKRVSRFLDPVLSQPPFLITSPTKRKKYIQDVIQDYLNSKLYAEDFFKIALDGKRMLYKGGYKKFIKDYYRVENEMIVNDIDEDNPNGKIEKEIVKEWKMLRTIALGIARIFDAFEYQMSSPDTFKTAKETRVDVYRPMFLGVEKIDKEPKGTKYHSLASLLHKEEKAPSSMNIGVTDLTLAKIKEQFYKYEIEGFHPGELLRSMGGLKLLFMSFGLRKLLAEKCLKKVDNNKYILVKLPKYGWLEAMATIQRTNAKLWVSAKDSKADFKKWERVRASLSEGMKARLFIRSIFTPTGSVVKENFNWWQGLWHGRAVWKKNKRITMAHLGEITINPSHFEKFMAQDRGYLDMIEKTSHRVPGTTVYQPNAVEVLNKTNDYIEYGLTSILMNATDKNFHKVVPNLVKKLGIEGKIGMDMNSLLNLDKVQILDVLYKALKLNNIEPDQLKNKKELIKLIRVGFILGRRIETSKKWAEVMNKNLDTRPFVRQVQLEALKNGCPVYLLKAVQQKVHLALIAFANGEIPPNIQTQKFGAGVTASMQLFETNGHSMYLTLGIFGQGSKEKLSLQESCIPFVGLSGAIKAGKKLSFRWMVGATTSFAGAAVGLETPIGKSDYNMYFGGSAGIDYKKTTVGVGGGLGMRWDRERSEKRQVKESLEVRNIKDIDTAIKRDNKDLAAKLILNHATFGKLMKRIKAKFKIDNPTIIDIYLQSRKDWVNYAKRNMKVPWILGAGVGGFVGIDIKSGKVASFGVGGYITFKIPGTEVNYVIRHEHPQYSEYMQKKSTAVELRKKLREEGIKNFKIAPYVIKAASGILYFDSHMGRTAVARRVREEKANVASGKYEKGKGKGKVNTFHSTFELVKKTFSKLNMHVEKVKDPKNPKGWLLALTPLQTEDSNVEVLIDPAMKARGLILDSANNRFLVSANLATDLFVTRSTYRYPFQRRGAMNLHVIAFKSNPDIDNNTLRNRSPWSIYKFKGERYQRLKNEALGKQHYDVKMVSGKPVLVKKPSNVLTLAEYKNSKRNFETFNDYKAEYTGAQAEQMSYDLFKAMEYKEIEKVRTTQLQLKKFSDWLYKVKSFSRDFDNGVGKLKSPDQENKFKTKWFKEIAKRYKEFAKLNPELKGLTLNEQEKNLIYAVLLDKSFSKLIRKKKPNPRAITRRLEIRNNLFKKYMRIYIKNYIKNNKEEWNEIKRKYKGATVEGIINYLLLCMPQNYEMLKNKFLTSKDNVILKAGIKYGSYTHRRSGQAMPTGFGADAPEFKDTLKMIKPTKLNVNSHDPDERAAANLILRMMSPLSTKNLETATGAKKFLESELSQLLLSMHNENGISPLLPILGIDKFKGLTKIVSKLKGKPSELGNLLKNNKHVKEAFKDFKTIVLGIRAAQLNGKSTFTFKDRFVFHVAKTSIYAGPYLKCGNGTVAVHQMIGITVKGVKRGRLYGAQTDRNIRISASEKKAYGQFTFGLYTGHKLKTHKKPVPPRKEIPHKTPTQPRTPSQSETIGEGSAANPAPSTAVQGNPTEGTGNL